MNITIKPTPRDYKAAGLTLRQLEHTWDNYIIKDAAHEMKIDAIKKAAAERKWIFMQGNPGTGKDHIATCIAKDVLNIGGSVRYVNTFRLLIEIQSNFLDADDIITEYSNVDLLVLNEIEKTFDTSKGNEKNVLFEIIDCRYNNLKKGQTIFITNSTWEDIHKKFALHNGTNPITDRISENGEVFIFDWESYRSAK